MSCTRQNGVRDHPAKLFNLRLLVAEIQVQQIFKSYHCLAKEDSLNIRLCRSCFWLRL